jgi:hypothetical protein
MSEERCKNCRYWLEKTDRLGQCRRYPPVPIVHVTYDTNSNGDLDSVFSSEPDTHFPITTLGEWCGEWKQKDGRNDE